MEKTWTILSLLKWTENYFHDHRIPTPRIDSEILIAHALNTERIRLYIDFERPLDENQLALVKGFIQRRIRNEPVAYIVGYKDFFGLRFLVNKNVLIPRPETELLVEEVLKYDRKGKSLLDIGTGCGNIGISLKKFSPEAKVTLCDVSPEALSLAEKNARALLGETEITFVNSDIYDQLSLSFDLIVSNPPYVPSVHLAELESTVKDFEPVRALEAGADGMIFYRRIISQLREHLNPGGFLFLEISPFLLDKIVQLVQEHGHKTIRVTKDYSGQDRVLVVQNA